MTLFWAVTLCGLVGTYLRFGETYCFHLQAHGVTTENNNTIIFTAVKTSNVTVYSCLILINPKDHHHHNLNLTLENDFITAYEHKKFALIYSSIMLALKFTRGL
jgi:hypothetical protein